MAEEAKSPIDDLDTSLDLANLYTEATLTDRRTGVIRILTPVGVDGERDVARPVLYRGETQIMTQMGPLPVQFDIPAKNTQEAVEKFSDAAKQGIKDMLAKIREMRREAASQIGTPDMPGFQAPPPAGSRLVMP